MTIAPLNLTKTEIAWLAGLFEGEAYFAIDDRSKSRYKVSTSPGAPFLKISMVDKDVIVKVAKLLKKQHFVPTRKTTAGKVVYTLHIGDRESLSYLLPRLLPYMGKRRSIKVQQGIDAIAAWQEWLAAGGRSLMAKNGPKSQKEGKL